MADGAYIPVDQTVVHRPWCREACLGVTSGNGTSLGGCCVGLPADLGVPVVWGSGAGSCGGVVRARFGVFECCCVSVCFGIRLVLGEFRGLCTVVFSSKSNVVVVVRVSVFRVFGLFCGLVGGGV